MQTKRYRDTTKRYFNKISSTKTPLGIEVTESNNFNKGITSLFLTKYFANK